MKVTVKEAAERMGVSPRYIHFGLQDGVLPFGVASYRDTSRVDFDKALSYLANWRPQGALLREIEFANEGAGMCVG